MSASSKKKLRKEQNAAAMTEKQLQEQKEAKKLRLYTGIFAVAIAVMILVVAFSRVSSIRVGLMVLLAIAHLSLSWADICPPSRP